MQPGLENKLVVPNSPPKVGVRPLLVEDIARQQQPSIQQTVVSDAPAEGLRQVEVDVLYDIKSSAAEAKPNHVVKAKALFGHPIKAECGVVAHIVGGAEEATQTVGGSARTEARKRAIERCSRHD